MTHSDLYGSDYSILRAFGTSVRPQSVHVGEEDVLPVCPVDPVVDVVDSER